MQERQIQLEKARAEIKLLQMPRSEFLAIYKLAHRVGLAFNTGIKGTTTYRALTQ